MNQEHYREDVPRKRGGQNRDRQFRHTLQSIRPGLEQQISQPIFPEAEALVLMQVALDITKNVGIRSHN